VHVHLQNLMTGCMLVSCDKTGC